MVLNTHAVGRTKNSGEAGATPTFDAPCVADSAGSLPPHHVRSKPVLSPLRCSGRTPARKALPRQNGLGSKSEGRMLTRHVVALGSG